MPSPEENPKQPQADEDLEQAFTEADQLIQNWKQQYAQVRQIQQQVGNRESPLLQPEMQRLQRKLKDLELDLALTILNTVGDTAREKLAEFNQQESFWHWVRFGGLGFVLGLAVHALVRR